MRIYSTREAARRLGISLISLQRYIAAGKVSAPKTRRIAGALVRPWSVRDIERVRKQLPKIKDGRRRRKKK